MDLSNGKLHEGAELDSDNLYDPTVPADMMKSVDKMDNPSPASTSGQNGTPARSTIGQELRDARVAAGLTVAEVAERTKVRPGILTDIEEDAHSRLPALTYTLGFVKAYARTVGIDPAVAADRYRQESHKGEFVPTMVDLQPLEEQRLPSRGLIAGSVVALLVALFGFWAWGAGWFTSDPAEVLEPETVATSETDVAPTATETPEAVALSPAVPAGPPVVTVTANDEVWLRISDGDETLFMGTLAKGQVMTLPAGRQWTVRTGRAGALDVRVGDKLIAPLGGMAETIRNVQLTPEALLARGTVSNSPVPAPAVAQVQPQAASR